MKIKEKAKVAAMSVKELQTKLETLQKDLVAERMQASLGKAKNQKMQTTIRRDIARVKTIITKLNGPKPAAKKS